MSISRPKDVIQSTASRRRWKSAASRREVRDAARLVFGNLCRSRAGLLRADVRRGSGASRPRGRSAHSAIQPRPAGGRRGPRARPLALGIALRRLPRRPGARNGKRSEHHSSENGELRPELAAGRQRAGTVPQGGPPHAERQGWRLLHQRRSRRAGNVPPTTRHRHDALVPLVRPRQHSRRRFAGG